jgi:hypothetical protein
MPMLLALVIAAASEQVTTNCTALGGGQGKSYRITVKP